MKKRLFITLLMMATLGATAGSGFAYAEETETEATEDGFVMEAEYAYLDETATIGYSSSVHYGASGAVMTDTKDYMKASNGYYLSSLWVPETTVTFTFEADAEDPDAELILRLGAKDYKISCKKGDYTVLLNGEEVDVDKSEMKANTTFEDVSLGTVALQEGENTLQIVVTNENSLGGTTQAQSPDLDCVKIKSAANLTWEPHEENVAGAGGD